MVHKKNKFASKEKKIKPDLQRTFRGGHKKGRIIVRNLPFKNLSEGRIKNFFSKFGNIVDIQLLRKNDGKFVGCGFVEFEKTHCAAQAIHQTSGTEMSGRTIIVDWAVPQHAFMERVMGMDEVVKKEVDDGKAEEDENKVEEVGDEVEEHDDNDDENDNEEIEDDNDDGNEEDELDFEDDDEEDFEDDDGGGSDGDEDEDDKKEKKTLPSDVDEGKTVFVKNVPFSATNEDVKGCFRKYGTVAYALICIDKLTEHSKGSAFVKFKEKDSATKAIKDSKNIVLMDQLLEVTLAVTKDHLEDVKKKKKSVVKDSRNLYLLREGVVLAGSPAAASVSVEDMAKRLQIETWKSQILKNLNMFVSKTRLVVHNIPTSYTDNQLRALFVKYSRPSAVVKEARIMRDKKKFDQRGELVSKEVGFVSFTTHEDALYALRNLNNNPTIFSPGHRPIVGFSIENRAILNLKNKRAERSRDSNPTFNKNTKEKDLIKLNSKQRRFLKRKEKLIALRQQTKQLKKEGKLPEKSTVVKESNKSTPKAISNKSDKSKLSTKKRKNSNEKSVPAKKGNTDVPLEEFRGVTGDPGKKIKLRSSWKLNEQAKIHKERRKEIKAKRKIEKLGKAKLKERKMREPSMKKQKANLATKDSLNKMMTHHKYKIIGSNSFKKWFEN